MRLRDAGNRSTLTDLANVFFHGIHLPIPPRTTGTRFRVGCNAPARVESSVARHSLMASTLHSSRFTDQCRRHHVVNFIFQYLLFVFLTYVIPSLWWTWSALSLSCSELIGGVLPENGRMRPDVHGLHVSISPGLSHNFQILPFSGKAFLRRLIQDTSYLADVTALKISPLSLFSDLQFRKCLDCRDHLQSRQSEPENVRNGWEGVSLPQRHLSRGSYDCS